MPAVKHAKKDIVTVVGLELVDVLGRQVAPLVRRIARCQEEPSGVGGDPVPLGVLIVVETDLALFTARETSTGLDKIRLTHVVLTREVVLTRARHVLALVLIRIGSTSGGRVVAGASEAPTIVALTAMLFTGAPTSVILTAVLRTSGGRGHHVVRVVLVPRAPTRGFKLPRVGVEAGKVALGRNGDLDCPWAVLPLISDRASEIDLFRRDPAVAKRVERPDHRILVLGRSSEGVTGGAKRRLHDVVAPRPILVLRINRWERRMPSSSRPRFAGRANLKAIILHAFLEFFGLVLLRSSSVVCLGRVLHKE